MIYNKIMSAKTGKVIDTAPTYRQNTWLLSRGADETYGCDFNGYGWKNHVRKYFLNTQEVRAYNKIGKVFVNAPKRKVLSQEDIIYRWAKRLCKFIDIPMDTAIDIAREKLEYKEDKILELADRQLERYSVKRESLINKLTRENPLRRIVDLEHAEAIMAASNRHCNTNYEAVLEQAKDMAFRGELDVSEVREYARSNYKSSGQV